MDIEYPVPYSMTVVPPMYGCRTSGIWMQPSSSWQFSMMAIRVRPTASPEPFRVCTSSGLPVAGLRQRALMRRRTGAPPGMAGPVVAVEAVQLSG